MDELTTLKAEIFDLQVKAVQINNLIKQKIAQINKLQKEKEKENGMVQ